MATEYFWQGGRKIEVEHDETQITIHAASPAEAHQAAERAGPFTRSPGEPVAVAGRTVSTQRTWRAK